MPGLVVAVLAVPSLALAADGGVGSFTGERLIGACKGLLALPALLAISQFFPTAVRVTAGALAYNLAQAIFGGTGPIIGVWLNDVTGGPYGLGVYLAVLGLITAVVAVLGAAHLRPRRGRGRPAVRLRRRGEGAER